MCVCVLAPGKMVLDGVLLMVPLMATHELASTLFPVNTEVATGPSEDYNYHPVDDAFQQNQSGGLI